MSRSRIHFSIVAFLLLAAAPFVAGGCHADTGGTLLIYEVLPDSDIEGVSIFNYGQALDIVGYSITDGEGTITFGETFMMPSGSRVSVVTETGDAWFCARDSVYAVGTFGIYCTGSFKLNNSGDEVILCDYYRDPIDVFVYGSSDHDIGWTGEPVNAPKAEYRAVRNSGTDTDTAADWELTIPGMTEIEDEGPYDAVVSPFVFPECEGMPIFSALESAEQEVCISMYLLTNERIVSLLMDLEGRGVEVMLLLEGSPAGVSTAREMSAMRSLVDAGGDVSIISKYDSQKRYPYLHAKYCVIDRQSVIVTSENWTGSFGNRGWGVTVESEHYAECMHEVFMNDRDTSYGDVRPFASVYPTYKAAEIPAYVSVGEYGIAGYRSTVSPVLSPDNSMDSLESLFASAEVRIYSEQLDVSESWADGTGYTPISWMSAAADRGVDCRLLLDASFDGEGTGAHSVLETISVSTSISAAAVDGGDGFDTVHNKGVIVDDKVWVGSVNWTENSFANNRECAVIIDSPEVTQYFHEWFMADWEDNYIQLPVESEVEVGGDPGSGIVTIAVLLPYVCSSPSCEWDFDGDGAVDRVNSITKVAFSMLPGEYSGTVTVTDGSTGRMFTGTYGYSVSELPPDDRPSDVVWSYLPLAVISLFATVFRVIRCYKRNTSEK